MRLLLVRHGESICGANGIVGGERGCTGLTERGFAQARALRQRFRHEGIRADVLLASTLPRAYQTAAVLSEVLELEAVLDADLCELVPGAIDGRLWEEWRAQQGEFDMEAEPDRPLSPGGESLTAFRSRVHGLLDRLGAEHFGEIVVAVCHGGVIYNSHHVLGGRDPDGREWAAFTAITEWLRDEDGWTLVRHNDVAHLEGTDLLLTT